MGPSGVKTRGGGGARRGQEQGRGQRESGAVERRTCERQGHRLTRAGPLGGARGAIEDSSWV